MLHLCLPTLLIDFLYLPPQSTHWTSQFHFLLLEDTIHLAIYYVSITVEAHMETLARANLWNFLFTFTFFFSWKHKDFWGQLEGSKRRRKTEFHAFSLSHPVTLATSRKEPVLRGGLGMLICASCQWIKSKSRKSLSFWTQYHVSLSVNRVSFWSLPISLLCLLKRK